MWILLILALLLRFFLLPWPAFGIDMNDWLAWANHLAQVGPGQFYQTTWSDYLPGYLYLLWFLGNLANWFHLANWQFEWFLKLPAVLADLGIGWLIYRIVRDHKSEAFALLVSGLFLFNPFAVFNSSVWGQVDAVFSLALLLSAYLLTKKKEKWPFFILGIAFLFKPQAVFFIPVLLLYLFRRHSGLSRIDSGVVISFLPRMTGYVILFLATIFLISLPFFPHNPLFGLPQLILKSAGTYPYASVFAMNFWGIWGTWKPDNLTFLSLSYQIWGFLLLAAGLGLSWRKVKVYLAAGLISLSFFMLPTRVHERWLYSFFPFFLIVCALANQKRLWFVYALLSLIHFLNLYYVYTYYNDNFLKIVPLSNFIGSHFALLSMIGFGSFLVLAWWYFFDRTIDDRKWKVGVEDGESKMEKENLSSNFHFQPPSSIINHLSSVSKKSLSWSKKEIVIVFLLVFVSFLIRVIRLDIPKNYYFDEVYHAFTAVEMEKGNKMAWEWWNAPPKGFAYEWTHPPLVKEMMIGGIRGIRWIRGIKGFEGIGGGGDAFGWRFPGVILGTGCVLLVYLLGRELFNPRVGLIAAFLASFDGLLFTQARIGMNDIYFLFFMLLAFYFFIRQQTSVANGNFESASDSLAKKDFDFKSKSSALANEASQNLLAPSVFFKRNINLFLMGISLGLALASKWTAVYGIGILGGIYLFTSFACPKEVKKKKTACEVFLWLLNSGSLSSGNSLRSVSLGWPLAFIKQQDKKLQKAFFILKRTFKFFFIFLLIPIVVYLLIYLPFFQSGHSWAQFDELQHQMWWYHTGLKAAHPYTSPWYSWPFLQRPVWYYVDYGISQISQIGQIGKPTVANIYGMGNPVIWWAGIGAVGWILIILIRRVAEVAKGKWGNLLAPRDSRALIFILIGYFGFFLPWAFSPRIMFLYHYLPSLPFLCLGLGHGLDKISRLGVLGSLGYLGGIKITGKLLTFAFLLLTFLTFVYFYPHWSALPIPKWLDDGYYWLGSWR